MPMLKHFKNQYRDIIYTLSGEIVTIFKNGVYNYEDTRRPDRWECGSVIIKDRQVDFGPIPPALAVKEAYELLGYSIKG